MSELWVNRLNQLAIAAEETTGRISVYTVKDMGVIVIVFRIRIPL